MDKFLYHITKAKNLDSILQYGLLVNSNNNGFINKSYIKNYHIKYGMQPIFLTSDVQFICDTQLTDVFLKDTVILKVDVEGLLLEGEYDYLDDRWDLYYSTKENWLKDKVKCVGKSFICRENIKPVLITKFDGI